MNPQRTLLVSAAVAAVLAATGTARPAAQPESQQLSAPAAPAADKDLPPMISLTGVVRDFKAYDVAGGHPDFGRYNSGHRVGMIDDHLDANLKPSFVGLGQTVTTQFRDRDGRNINPASFDAAQGDVAGQLTQTSAVCITSAASFSQWYRDIPGLNASKSLSITLVRQPGTNLYVFQAQDDPATPEIEGFFPADGDLLRDDEPGGHNYSFTFELNASFVYNRGSGQVFTFAGDDDVWVFINNTLVIDVGGVHGPVSQTIDLDRIPGLVDGQSYPLHFFFAERHRTGANCRIETSLTLHSAPLPATTALYD
ncbi:MAG: fibro-slime domain-containing protein [Phycisphaeraceae bacterium]|nr:fibro-slime domain-containing protein [Phycisphaeraceae bacterium]